MACETSENLWKLLKQNQLETDNNSIKDFQITNGQFDSECGNNEILSHSKDDPMRFAEKVPSSQSTNINPKLECVSRTTCNNETSSNKTFPTNSSNKFGCHVNELISREMENHLTVENYSHGNLLIEWINNMTNEIESLNKGMRGLKVEIKLLKEENESFKKENDKYRLLFNELLSKPKDREIINFEKKELTIKTKQTESNYGMKEIIKLISDLSSILNQLDEVCKEFDQMKQTQIKDSENVMDILTEFDKKQRYIFSKLNDTNCNMEILIGKASRVDGAIKILDDRTKKHDDKISNFELSIDRQNYGYYIWNVKSFSEKLITSQNWTDPVFYSDPFYTHKYGYRLRLCIYPDGNNDAKGSYLSIYFCLVRGQFDNILSWPIKPSVTIELINQHTGQIHVSKTAGYEDYPNSESWNKPISEKNNGLGFCKFIKLEDLMQIPTLINDDQIFIKCSVNLEL